MNHAAIQPLHATLMKVIFMTHCPLVNLIESYRVTYLWHHCDNKFSLTLDRDDYREDNLNPSSSADEIW